MDFFDECILDVLRDGETGDFRQLLERVDFSRNILLLHLRRLMNRGWIVEGKSGWKGRGRLVADTWNREKL